MPVAIIIAGDTAPAIIERATDDDLLDAIAALAVTPADAAGSVEAATTWLASLPAPSGWFASTEEAAAFQRRAQIERDSQLLKAARSHLKATQRDMTTMLGLADPNGDGFPVRRIEGAKQGLSGPARRLLAYILKHGAIAAAEEADILGRIGNGSWRIVARSDMRKTIKDGGGIKLR